MQKFDRNARLRKRIVAIALAFFCVFSAIPQSIPTASAAETTYGRVTTDNVKVRKSASTSAEFWFKLPKDWVSEIVETVVKSGVTWYKVNTNGPTQGTRTYIGYILGDYFLPMTAEEQAAWLLNPVQPGIGNINATAAPTSTDGSTPVPGTASTPIPDPSNYGEINKGGVNFGKTPGGQIIGKLENGYLVELVEIPAYLTEDYWFKVKYGGETGYVQAQLVTILTKDQAADLQGQQTAVPTATPAPGTVYGYVRLTQDGVNLRSAEAGSVIARVDGKPVLPYMNAPTSKRGFTWYYVKTESGVYGYVRSDVAEKTDSTGVTATPAATSTPAASSVVTATPAAETAYGYVKLTQEGVNLRKTEAGSMIARIDGKPVLPYLKAPTQSKGYTWYYVKTATGLYGYVRSDVMTVTDQGGSTPGATATPSATAGDNTSSIGYIKLTSDGVNLRKVPNGAYVARLPIDTILALTAQPTVSGKYTWYPVRASSGQAGYIRGDMAVLCDQSGATAAPTATPTPAPVTATGYVLVTAKSVNLRKSIGGATISTVDKDTVWPLVSAAVKSGSYTWYPVDVNGTRGFLRGDVAYQMSDFQVQAYLSGQAVPTPTPTPTPTPGPSNYLITTVDKVNLRTSASKDANAPYNVEIGTVFPFSSSSTVGGSLWYKIEYEDADLWVQGICVKVMNTQEYQNWLSAQPTPTPSPTPTPTPKPEDLSDMAETSSDNVLVRAAASSTGKQVTKIYNKGTIFTWTGSSAVSDGYTWYSVKLKSGTTGWIRGDLMRIYTKDEKEAYENGNNTGGQQEATYETLVKGSTGEAVKKLQTELKEQGYYSGSISGTYGTETVEAVKAFQKAKGLTVDGIAGSTTQHKLFGTVPPGSTDETLTNTIYPVEKIDWVTGGINSLWARGMNVKVTDVKTGIVFWAHRWAGGNHVDAEPLTAADTRRICRMYGVSTAAEIASKNLWQRRPLWVTIGSRTFAASLYGVPHNYPDGDTISTNNYDGQFCIHFTNSKTHTSNRVDPLHAAAIQEAYDAAPSRK